LNSYDFIVIGGGVVGSMIARSFSRYEGKVLLIEKDADIGMGSTCANSAIVHAGYDPTPGSLKAQMNVSGNAMFDELSQELGFGFDRRGDFVVAVGEEELPTLGALLEQGRRRTRHELDQWR
jgi:glycerol-3-phosphate dehydrogenase